MRWQPMSDAPHDKQIIVKCEYIGYEGVENRWQVIRASWGDSFIGGWVDGHDGEYLRHHGMRPVGWTPMPDETS